MSPVSCTASISVGAMFPSSHTVTVSYWLPVVPFTSTTKDPGQGPAPSPLLSDQSTIEGALLSEAERSISTIAPGVLLSITCTSRTKTKLGKVRSIQSGPAPGLGGAGAQALTLSPQTGTSGAPVACI